MKHARLGKLLLAAALMLGFALRFYGIGWGLPERIDLWPDELDYVVSKAAMLSWQTPDSGFYNYPQFLASMTALLHGGIRRGAGIFGVEAPLWWLTLVGRCISAFFGWLTILAAWLLARGLRAGWLGAGFAALFVAILPLNVWDSHVCTTDVLMGCWCVMTLAASVHFLKNGGSFRGAVWMGVCLGLATAGKYTAAITAIAPFCAVALLRTRPYPWKRAALFLLVAATASLVMCFIAIPFSFIHVDKVLEAMAFERAHTARGHNGFDLFAPGWIYRKYVYQVFAAWPFSLGIALCALAYAGAAGMLLRPSRERVVVWSFFALFWGVTGSWTYVPIRYYMPLATVLAVFAGIWLGERLEEARPRRWRWLFGLVGASVFLYTLAFTCSTVSRYPNDTRITAGKWLAGLNEHPVIHSAGWSRYHAAGNPGRVIAFPEGRLHRKTKDIPEGEWLQASSIHSLRWIRSGHPMNDVYARLADTNRFELAARFERRYLNQWLYERLDPMYANYFIAPTLSFYRRIIIPPAD